MRGGVRAALHWLPWCVSCMLAAASALSMNGMDWRRPAFRAECRAPWMDMNMIACCRYANSPGACYLGMACVGIAIDLITFL